MIENKLVDPASILSLRFPHLFVIFNFLKTNRAKTCLTTIFHSLSVDQFVRIADSPNFLKSVYVLIMTNRSNSTTKSVLLNLLVTLSSDLLINYHLSLGRIVLHLLKFPLELLPSYSKLYRSVDRTTLFVTTLTEYTLRLFLHSLSSSTSRHCFTRHYNFFPWNWFDSKVTISPWLFECSPILLAPELRSHNKMTAFY